MSITNNVPSLKVSDITTVELEDGIHYAIQCKEISMSHFSYSNTGAIWIENGVINEEHLLEECERAKTALGENWTMLTRITWRPNLVCFVLEFQ